MNEKIIFVRTHRGEDEIRNRTAHLSKDIKRALLMVDGIASVSEIMKRSSPSLRGMLEDMFIELVKGGFIEDKFKVSPLSNLVQPIQKSAEAEEELDFTAAFVAARDKTVAKHTRIEELAAKAQAERQVARALAEKDAVHAREQAARHAQEQEKSAQAAEQLKAELAKAKADAEVAKSEARAAEQARIVADAAKAQAEREAREARMLAEKEATRARSAEQDRHAAAKAQAELLAAELAISVKAEKDAAREQAEQDAARIVEGKAAAAELAKAQAARAEQERMAAEKMKIELDKAKADAEAARSQARVAEQARIIADAAKAQAEREARDARMLAEKEAARARVEAARIRAEQEAVEARAVEAEKLAAQLAKLQAESRAHSAEQDRLAAAKAQAEREACELAIRVKAEKDAARELAERSAKEAEEKVRAVAAQNVRIKAELVQLKAQAEAEAAVQAEQVAARALEAVRIEAARQHREASEAAHRAEQHEAQRKAEAAAEARTRAALEAKEKLELELAKLKEHVEAQVRAGLEAEALATAVRLKDEQEVVRIREEVERSTSAVRAQAVERDAASVEQQPAREKALEQERELGQTKTLAAVVSLNAKNAAMEESVFSELDELIQHEAACDQTASFPATERRKARAAVQGCDSRGGNNGVRVVERRVITVAVVFLDIVGYTKQSNDMQIGLKQKFNQLVMRSLDELDPEEWIILDTGDGAAIGFLQHPTDAMAMAMRFCADLLAGGYADGSDLRVRIGVNLGPVSLVRDMNGQINMLGDGINSAQRVMSFAGQNQIYVSRAYVDFVSSLSDEYDDLFRYRGAQQDKHGREHQVYELLVVEAPLDESGSMPPGNVDTFNFDAFDVAVSSPPEPVNLPEPLHVVSPRSKDDAGARLLESVESYLPTSLPENQPVLIEAPAQVDVECLPENSPEPVVLVEAPTHVDIESRPADDTQVEKRVAAEPQAVVPADKKVPGVPAAAIVKIAHHKAAQPWGKWAAGLVILLILALFAVPFVVPTQGYAVRIEQLLSEKLQQPVHIGHLAGRILPVPRLTLSDVSIGKNGQIQTRQAQINFAFTGLFSSVKLIDSLELDGVQVQGAGLPEVSAWLQQMAGDPLYSIRRITFAHGQLDADGIPFSDVEGVLDFDLSGKFSDAHFDADGHKLALQIHAMPADKMQLTLALRDSALPSLPNWTFEAFKATGELSRDELRITSLEGQIRGGVLTGSARINWRRGWRVQGELAAKGIVLQNINKLLAGDLDGSARFQMQAESLVKLADAAIVTGEFNVKKGLINGVDIVETARLYSRENLPGGRTHFDEMSSHFSYANGGYQFGQLKLNDSMVKASGTLTIAGSALSGNISANLAMRAGSVALQITGTTESPSLHVAP